MPKSFLVKRIQKVNTAFFPWNSSTLIPGYSLSYAEVDNCNNTTKSKDGDTRHYKEGYEESVSEIDGCSDHQEPEKHVNVLDVEDGSPYIDKDDHSQRITYPKREFKVLKPHIFEEKANIPDMNHLTRTSYYNNSSVAGNVAGNVTGTNEELIPSPIRFLKEDYKTFLNHRFPSSSTPPVTPTQPLALAGPLYNDVKHYYHPHHHQHSDRKPFIPIPPAFAFNPLVNFRKHQCEYCFKWFKRSSSLSNHRLIHKNDKTFKCSQCNMCFLRKSDLGKHMVIHSGSKPYQCNVCGKRFSQSSNMLTHQRRHTGIRPYSCHICGKSFYRKVDVRRHASVHRDY